MMKPIFKQQLYFIVALSLLSACQAPNTSKDKDKLYFEVESLITQQIQWLEKIKPKVEKQVVVDGKLEQKTIEVQSWAKELEMFMQADLNKPALRDAYTKKDSSASNEKFTIYTAREARTTVRRLRIAWDGQQAKSLQAWIRNENYLYISTRHLTLLLASQPPQNQWLVRQYSIETMQKMIFNQPRSYRLIAKIMYQ
ncbi:MAG TPA: hypothetical protein DCM08_00070 [Microscillaceae bacterium]|nr:hypothetical protein [Microscillaceae bacterium]